MPVPGAVADAGPCPYCGAEGGKPHVAREMMLGLRHRYTVIECGRCGSLRLADPPSDLDPYYPADYYSLTSARRARWPLRVARRLRGEAALRGHPRLARVLGRGAPPPQWPDWLSITGLTRRARILDVGSGTGALLLSLRDQGFRRLSGIDPFLPSDIVVGDVRISNARIEEVTGEYDLVMLNHAFEHLPDPRGAIRAARSLLSSNGSLMLRVPVAGSKAWRIFGIDWVGLDVPRHLHVPSERGLRLLAADERMPVYQVLYDSTAMQFWRSEQYAADIPLFDPRSYQVDPDRADFGRAQICAWEAEARRLNAVGDGDTAAFFLRAG